jgi:protein disulfide-isomerase-like protein
LTSAPVPKKNDGPVRILVGSTFREEVMDSDKDVLVEFMADWCGHCKTLAPKYKRLAEKFKANPNVVIAIMDGTKNEVPNLTLTGFPSIYLYAKGKKDKPIFYNGNPSESSLKTFVKKNMK